MEINNLEKDEIKLIIRCLEEKKKKDKKIKKVIEKLEAVIEADDIEVRRRLAPKIYWTTRTPISLR